MPRYLLRGEITSRGLTMRKLAEKLNTDYSTLRKEIIGEYQLEVYKAIDICKAITESDDEAKEVFNRIFFANVGSKTAS